RVWEVPPGTFDFEPLPPDPRRVKPLSPPPPEPRKEPVTTETKVERGRRGFFLFDFREHEKDLLALRTPEPEIVRAGSSWDWQLAGTGGPDDSPHLFCDDENDLTTVKALRA